MPTEELEANFSTLVKDVESCRLRFSGTFITHCWVLASPSREKFLIKHETYVGVSQRPSRAKPIVSAVEEEDEAEDEENERDDVDDDEPQKQKAKA